MLDQSNDRDLGYNENKMPISLVGIPDIGSGPHSNFPQPLPYFLFKKNNNEVYFILLLCLF